MNIDFSNKRILVTGVGQGIGRSLALTLSRAGATVYGVSKTQTNLDSLQTEDESIKTICQDVGDWKGLKGVLAELPPLDGVVNNAGIASTNPVLDVTEEELDRTFAVNFKVI